MLWFSVACQELVLCTESVQTGVGWGAQSRHGGRRGSQPVCPPWAGPCESSSSSRAGLSGTSLCVHVCAWPLAAWPFAGGLQLPLLPLSQGHCHTVPPTKASGGPWGWSQASDTRPAPLAGSLPGWHVRLLAVLEPLRVTIGGPGSLLFSGPDLLSPRRMPEEAFLLLWGSGL